MTLATPVQSQRKKYQKVSGVLILERFRGVNCKLKGLSSAVLHVSCHWPYAKVLFIPPPFPKKHLTFLMMQQKAV